MTNPKRIMGKMIRIGNSFGEDIVEYRCDSCSLRIVDTDPGGPYPVQEQCLWCGEKGEPDRVTLNNLTVTRRARMPFEISTKCSFSTGICETLTCSKDGEFDDNGYPKNECSKYPCFVIRRLRLELEKEHHERRMKQIEEEIAKLEDEDPNVIKVTEESKSDIEDSVECPSCEGSGLDEERCTVMLREGSKCHYCDGTGKVTKEPKS